MTDPNSLETPPQVGNVPAKSVWAALTKYDVATKRPQQDAAQMFQELAARYGEDLESLRVEYAESEKALVRANEILSGLRNRLNTIRRVRILMWVLGVAGTILIGFGVNYITGGQYMVPGWIMLMVGGLMQLGSLATALVDRED